MSSSSGIEDICKGRVWSGVFIVLLSDLDPYAILTVDCIFILENDSDCLQLNVMSNRLTAFFIRIIIIFVVPLFLTV